MKNHRIACFITPHGFGHATRACAIMAALRRIEPAVEFDIFTRVPAWLFEQSIAGGFNYHDVQTDIGLIQHNPLEEDIAETARRLALLMPFDAAWLDRLARQVKDAGCGLVLCDIAALGIAVAQAAGIPSVLVENFTWDWIYEGYLGVPNGAALQPFIDYQRALFDAADYHIQTAPINPHGQPDRVVAPVSRAARTPAAQVRAQLGVPAGASLVLITMGGMPEQYAFLPRLAEYAPIHFVVPGSAATPHAEGNLIRLPNHSAFYHPDVVHACDAVIGKLGYSTVAEAYAAGARFGYIPRLMFRESPVLEAFVRAEMSGLGFTDEEFRSGRWLDRLPRLLALPRKPPAPHNGADQAAEFLLGLLANQ
jgi:hypothetical protein